MYSVNELLKKLNGSKAKFGKGETLTATGLTSLAELMVTSPGERKALFKEKLTWGEAEYLQQAIEKEKKANKVIESRLLARANPQLSRAVHLGIRALPETQDYNDMFGGRADRYVKAGSVASMFSPAGYLTELYREGRKLHNPSSPDHIDQRRPDIATLLLSQQNQDEEISTLKLSNELLFSLCQAVIPETDVMKTLASHRLSTGTPYHAPYKTVHQAITLQDETLSTMEAAPAVISTVSSAYLAALKSDISPELYNLLTEHIPDDASETTIDALWKENFGSMSVDALGTMRALADYYEVSEDELGILFSLRALQNVTGSVYIDNSLTTMAFDTSGQIVMHTLKTQAQNIGWYRYFEVIPTGAGTYIVNFNLTKEVYKDDKSFKIYLGNKTVLFEGDNLQIDKHFSIPVEIPEGTLLTEQAISVRYKYVNSGVDVSAGNNFIEKVQSRRQFLLKANKVVRLYKASGRAPEIIRQIIASQGDTFNTDPQTLSILFYVERSMLAYGIDAEKALIFTHAGISQISINGSISLFDRLFNTPLMNNQKFIAEGQPLDLTLGDKVSDTFSLSVIKRGLQVNDNELRQLWAMTSDIPASQFTCTSENLSSLYLLRLLAQVNDLSINELAVLKSLSSLKDVPLEALTTADELGEMVSYVRNTCRWLKAQGWSVAQLFVMTTKTYSTNLTPELNNLMTTLRAGLDETTSDDDLVASAVPLIAAAVQLSSNESAASLLYWLDKLKPAGLTSAGFLRLVLENKLSKEIAIFSQALAQLSITMRALGLSDGEMHHLTLSPWLLDMNLYELPNDFDTLQLMSRFHSFINLCGTQADDIVSGLISGHIETDKLAEILGYDQTSIAQAQLLANAKGNVIRDFATVDTMMQWLSVADRLCVTPACVSALLALDYTVQTAGTAATWLEWLKISQMMTAGLSIRQSLQLQDSLDESLSTALSAYYITEVGSKGVNSRDSLYQHLLIDGQVSAQVKTTRLAEAIASLQLYINQTLNGVDNNVRTDVLSGQFFKDWETYNKRYSTWKGVSQLVYYPENYIDPALRVGQSKMMDTLLQSISQSSINKDTVEDAFKDYLTEFEQVANLDVISGYHDSMSLDTGHTYYIGRNEAQQTTYYWRSADHSKMKDGAIAANGWTEWNKIELGILPYKALIQPVIFNSRLYLCWIERTEQAKQDGTSMFSYTLKLSHIRYDNSWSAPVGFDITQSLLWIDGDSTTETPALYASNDNVKQELIIGTYKN